MQHTVTHCNTLQHTEPPHCNTMQHTATHCNTLQHTEPRICRHQRGLATACIPNPKSIRDTATPCNTLHHTETHCNALQRTATHCNTLQHTEPRICRHQRGLATTHIPNPKSIRDPNKRMQTSNHELKRYNLNTPATYASSRFYAWTSSQLDVGPEKQCVHVRPQLKSCAAYGLAGVVIANREISRIQEPWMKCIDGTRFVALIVAVTSFVWQCLLQSWLSSNLKTINFEDDPRKKIDETES